jgi:DNA-binding XRE family transcriptional regulator
LDFSVISRAGLTQQEFATIGGVSRVTVNMWVKGRMAPHRFISAKIAALLRHLENAIEHASLPLPVNTPKGDRVVSFKRVISGEVIRAQHDAATSVRAG